MDHGYLCEMLCKRLPASKGKCEKCGKSFTNYVVRLKNFVSGKWKTKTVQTLKMAKDVESKFKTEVLEGKVFDKKMVGAIQFDRYLECAKVHKKTWMDDFTRWNLLEDYAKIKEDWSTWFCSITFKKSMDRVRFAQRPPPGIWATLLSVTEEPIMEATHEL